MRELIQQIDRLERKVDGLAVLEGGGGSGGVTTASPPLAIAGTNIALSVTPANPGGAVALQAATPGTQQTGNANFSGKLITGGDVAATGNVSGVNVNATTSVQLNGVKILESGTTFPTSSLVDGQRYRHMTYRSWFTYNLSALLWRQDAPGVFSGSFPTVAAGDNTVAPVILVSRVDENGRIYFYNGTAWFPLPGSVVVLDQVCRVLDDTTSRATGFTNSAVQVTGTTDIRAATFTMPTKLRGVWFSMFLITAAGANVRMVVENPDFTAGASTLQGSTVLVGAVTAYSGGGLVSLSSVGQMRYVYGGSANVTRTIIDIWGYVE